MKNKHNFQAKKSHLVEKRYIKMCARKGLLKKKSSYRPEVTTVSLILCALLFSFCTWLTLAHVLDMDGGSPISDPGRGQEAAPMPCGQQTGYLACWCLGPPPVNLPPQISL